MPRGRAPMPVGTWGHIAVTGDQQPYRATARIRDHDGTVRRVLRTGQTKTAARNALLDALRSRQALGGGTITGRTTITDLGAAWLEADHNWAVNTRRLYGIAADNLTHVLGGIRVEELRPALISRALTAIQDTRGKGAAKTARAALSGMCKLAIAHDALTANPVRDAAPLARGPRKPPRALTRDETDDLCDQLRSSARAVELDLPDLVEWMLATGCRIGEACAARSSVLELDAGTWEINATVVRVTGRGLMVQERPKSAAGWRVLALPSFAVAMVQRRAGELRWQPREVRFLEPGGLVRVEQDAGIVFPAAAAKNLRDPSNTSGDLREVLDSLGFDWVTSHVFRKTVATRLDEAGLTSRQIADQLGHAKPSMTTDVYMGRRVVNAEAARVLDR